MSNMMTRGASVAGRLEQGGRDEQLDALDITDDRWVVADGCGAAARASSAALAAFRAGEFAGAPTEALDAAVARAHHAVEALRGGNAISSTLTAAWLLGDEVGVAHVGDSRAWLLREGELRQLTHDHTEVQSLIDEGSLTEEEARSDPRRNLLNRALAAGSPVEADVFTVPVRAQDRLVLTTDGVHAVLERDSLPGLLGRGTPQETVDAVAAAVEDAGAPDNYAVVVADIA